MNDNNNHDNIGDEMHKILQTIKNTCYQKKTTMAARLRLSSIPRKYRSHVVFFAYLPFSKFSKNKLFRESNRSSDVGQFDVIAYTQPSRTHHIYMHIYDGDLPIR